MNKAYFYGKCVIKKVNPANGQEVKSWGTSKFTVCVTDNDQGSPQNTGTDTIAISFTNLPGGTPIINRAIGTSTAQIPIGGGNIVVHSKLY